MDYRYETKKEARDFHKQRKAFIVLDDKLEFLPDNSSMSHFEYCQMKGVTKEQFNLITRGYYLNGNVVFYKDNFIYDEELIEKSLIYLEKISQKINKKEFEIYFGQIPEENFALDFHYGRYENGLIITGKQRGNYMNDTERFIKGLKENNKKLVQSVPKIDIHNHVSYSCNKDYLRKNNISIGDEKVNDIESLIQFSRKYIVPLKQEVNGLYLLLNGTFENCIDTGISFVSTDIDYKDCIRTFNSNVEEFIKFLENFKYENLKIEWILEISRDSYNEEYKNIIIEMINSGFFSGIDLVSTENIVSNELFKDFYNIANELNLKTKVHAGEQLGADYIKQCIEDFNPCEIQHGISIVKDKEVMQLAKEKNIVFNVCPTSNLILGYVDNIKNHPIKKMVEYGLNVTIATDDMLYFDSDINDEYLKLYNNKVLTINELNKIRLFGLSIRK